MPEDRPSSPGPVLAPRGASPAVASDPTAAREDDHFHIYESNPIPWWLALLWLAYFAFAITYLIRNLME